MYFSCKFCMSSANFYASSSNIPDFKIKDEPFPLKIILEALTAKVNLSRENEKKKQIEENENIVKQTYLKGILQDIGFEDSELKNGYRSWVKFKDEISFDITDVENDIYKITLGYNKTFENIPKEDFENMARNIKKYYVAVR